ncbi:MAG TPA: response regulator [Acidobacteriota bacterium]|nr:response regulator [Acidobacteriota bacterium]
MSRRKIIAVEDETDIRKVIEYNLTREGFSVLTARDGDEGLKLIRREKPDLVLLDLMLPSRDGLDLCRTLKADDETRDIPIIMLTAKSEESDIVLGLGLGADDYITKPFGVKELVARIRSVLRRASTSIGSATEERLVRGDVVVDLLRHRVTVAGTPVDLTATEFRLLRTLAAHPGRVFTRDQLLNRVVGEDVVVTDRNIDVHVRSIRRKLAARGSLIETVRGIGYRFSEGYE